MRVKVAMTESDGIYYHLELMCLKAEDFLDMDVICLIRNNPEQIRGSVLRGNIFYRKGYAEICE